MARQVDFYTLRNLYDNLMYDGFYRPGEAHMTALRLVHQDLYDEIRGTEADCSDDDSRVAAFLRAIGYFE